jgi:hypothetical protein
VPYVFINSGMLPHQFSSFTEGLFGPLHSEFERTPKTATVTTRPTSGAPSSDGGSTLTSVPPSVASARLGSNPATPTPVTKPCAVKIHWPYVLTEAFFIVHQLAWAALFASAGLYLCAIGAAYMSASVLYLAFFYGDHAGNVCFIFPRDRRIGHPRSPTAGVVPATW